MTRQKKEILKTIDEMERSIQTDLFLGGGIAPASAFDSIYEEMYRLQEELAHLRHYASVEEMLSDTRGQTSLKDMDLDLPW